MGQWGSTCPAAVWNCISQDRTLLCIQPEPAEGKEAGEKGGEGAKTLKSASLIFLKLTWHKLQKQRSIAGTYNRGWVGRPSCCFASLPWDSNCLLGQELEDVHGASCCCEETDSTAHIKRGDLGTSAVKGHLTTCESKGFMLMKVHAFAWGRNMVSVRASTFVMEKIGLPSS